MYIYVYPPIHYTPFFERTPPPLAGSQGHNVGVVSRGRGYVTFCYCVPGLLKAGLSLAEALRQTE